MKTSTKAILAVVLFLIVIGIITAFLVIIQVPYTAKVIYTEQEPYNTQSCHDEQIAWSSPERACTGSFGFPGAGARCFDVKCTLNNKDSVGGTFKIQLKFWMNDALGYSSSQDYEKDVYVDSFGTASPSYNNLFCWPIDTELELQRMDINVIPPTKQVCDTITDYKDVKKTRTETRYCNAWKKLTGKCDDVTEYEK